MLGRYIYEDEHSSKYWTLFENPETGEYAAEWGRIGNRPQGRKDYTMLQAKRKVAEKVAKGYVLRSKEKRRDRRIANEASRLHKEAPKPVYDFLDEIKKMEEV